MHFELQNLNRFTSPRLPNCCLGCGWWQGHDDGWSEQEADHWNRAAEETFGRWGKLAAADGKLLGMIQFAPASLFTRGLSCGPAAKGSILLTCGMIADTSLDSVRKSLVLAMLAELMQDEAATVEAYCHQVPGAGGKGHLFEQDFLRDCGFYPVRSSGGVQLMRLELGGVQPVRLASRRSRRGLLERIKRPARTPVPVAFSLPEPDTRHRAPACV